METMLRVSTLKMNDRQQSQTTDQSMISSQLTTPGYVAKNI